MTDSSDRSRIASLAAKLDGTLPTAAAEPLAAYVGEVRRWNARVNLVAQVEPEALVEILVADALVLARPELVPPDARIVDVGAGAGAPTLPLLLLRPDLRALCVEPRHKRAAFLRATGARIGLADRLEVVEARVDPDAPALGGAPFDLALSRATFAPAAWLALGANLARRVAVLTARDAPPTAEAGLTPIAAHDYRLPTSGAVRRITVYAVTPAESHRRGPG